MKTTVFLLFLLFSSCSYHPLAVRPVTVRIPAHRWEASENLMWMSLVTSTGQETRLDEGKRNATVYVPYGRTVFVTVTPLGECQPFGGWLDASQKEVVLTQERGRLAGYLLDLSGTYGSTLSLLDTDQLQTRLQARDVSLWNLDMARLAADLLNNHVKESSIQALSRVPVAVQDIPVGRWIAEREDDDDFWYDGVSPVQMTFSDGYHRFLCRERGLVAVIYVDGKSVTSFTSVRERPVW